MLTPRLVGLPIIARLEIHSVPAHTAIIVTEAVVAAARIGTLNTWVFIPPATTVTAAGLSVNVKPVYTPSSIVASTVADVPPVLLNVIINDMVSPPT